MGSIYLIRHGQASFGADDYDVLSPTGVRQAQILGRHLAELGISLDRCLAGDLRRQQDTATGALDQFAAFGLPVPILETDAAFNEFDADAVIRALLPEMLPQEPQALHILRNAAQNRGEFQRIFALIIERWLAGTYDTPAWKAGWDLSSASGPACTASSKAPTTPRKLPCSPPAGPSLPCST